MSDGPGKYWICLACAAKKGWRLPDSSGITMCMGECDHCGLGIKVTLVPTRDFAKPKGKP